MNNSPAYITELLRVAGLSQRKAAHAVGVSERMMRYYLHPDAQSDSYRPAPDHVIMALELLALCATNPAVGAELEKLRVCANSQKSGDL